jgi:hypothetical protein
MKNVKRALLAVTLTLAGCSGSSSGGSSGTDFTAPSGTLGGIDFAATGAVGLTYGPSVCFIPDYNWGFTGLSLLFSNEPNLCSAIAGAGPCTAKANEVVVGAGVWRKHPLGATIALTVGTYPLSLATPVADANGNSTQTSIGYSMTDATCVATDVYATAGSLTISTISATRVTGSMTATFSDGSDYSGPFDVATCVDPNWACHGGLCGPLTCIP